MMDVIATQAVTVVECALEANDGAASCSGPRVCATVVVEALQAARLIARCSCPHGFGQVRDINCPAHGRRLPAHTIEMGSEP